MTMKDELDKLIAEKREKRDVAVSLEREQWTSRERRFRPLALALQEMVEAADPSLVRWRESYGDVVIEIGHTDGDKFGIITYLVISANMELRNVNGRAVVIDRPGFRVLEHDDPNYTLHCLLKERFRSFQTDQEVCEYVMALIAQHIAEQSHARNLTDTPMESAEREGRR